MKIRSTRARGYARTLLLLVASLALLTPPAVAAASTSEASSKTEAREGYILVKGRLVDTEGAPVTDYAVELGGTTAPHDATQGEFAWYVPADEPVQLEVVGPGDGRASFYGTFFTLRPDPISLTTDTDLGDLVMPPFRRSITIRVHDENNRPVPYLGLHQHATRLTDSWLGSGWQYSPLIKQSSTGWDTLSTWYASQTTDKRGETTFQEYPALRGGGLLAGMTAETYDSNNRTYVADFENAVRTGPDSFDVLMPGLRQPVTSPDAPPAPTAVGQDRSALVTWQAPFDGHSPITGYTITTDPGGGTTTVTDGDATSAVVTGLTNGSSYRFTVRATNAQGTGLPSEASNVAVPGKAPASPGAPEIEVLNTAVVATVRGVTGAETYQITASPGGATEQVGLGFGPRAFFSYLKKGTTYTFTATATNRYGTSAPSPASRAVTPAGPPQRMARPTVVVKKRSAVVSWKKADLRGGVLARYTVSATGERRFSRRILPGQGMRTTFENLRPGRYWFRVSAQNDNGVYSPASGSTAVRITR